MPKTTQFSPLQFEGIVMSKSNRLLSQLPVRYTLQCDVYRNEQGEPTIAIHSVGDYDHAVEIQAFRLPAALVDRLGIETHLSRSKWVSFK